MTFRLCVHTNKCDLSDRGHCARTDHDPYFETGEQEYFKEAQDFRNFTAEPKGFGQLLTTGEE